MFKIAILGVENSHANSFLTFLQKNKDYPDVEVKGIYSYDTEVMDKLSAEFSVPTMENYDSLVGQVDGIVITARHGSNHYKYAKPYIASGIPMFIDKPITSDPEEAVQFMAECEKHGIKLSGGSMLKHDVAVNEIKNLINEDREKLRSGFACCPIQPDSMYDGFWFYSQHLVETVLTAFGKDVKSVFATPNGKAISVIFRYDGFDVLGTYPEEANVYFIAATLSSGMESRKIELQGAAKKEFDEFYNVLSGGEMTFTYNEFIKPVFTIDAIMKSIKENKWVDIREE